MHPLSAFYTPEQFSLSHHGYPLTPRMHTGSDHESFCAFHRHQSHSSVPQRFGHSQFQRDSSRQSEALHTASPPA